ncbi:MAG: hypothetical protein HY865_03330 [Chloroflexi bacterium]|nr:hypothetical protein [Chloroflexota bacterium]
MKTKLENFIHGLILAPLAPLSLFLGGWWLAYFVLPEKWIPAGALFGLALGLLADIPLLRRWSAHANRLNIGFWVVVFLFYSIGIFGFFMGVPVFNLALALPAGFIFGDRLAAKHADEVELRHTTRRVAGFTTGALTLVCMASAIIALADPYTEANLQGMFGLPFEVTRNMVIGLIAIGGSVLLVFNWLLAFVSIRFTYSFFKLRA